MPTPRSKTFTGCWTCRARHVKCDEEKPYCSRCRRNNWRCQGYGVRLGWTNSDSPTITPHHRRQVRSSARMPSGMTSSRVSSLLSELDSWEGTGDAQRGPFSVFSLAAADKSQTTQMEDEFSAPRVLAMSPGVGSDTTLPSRSTPSDEKLPVYTSPPSTPYILNPTPMTCPEIELIHHWVVFLSGNMLLIDTADNPCRTVFMPLALKGRHTAPSHSNIHSAIFHAICAASAFSLYHLRHEPRFQSLAMLHDQQALSHLRQNLQPGTRLDEPTLAAVLCCITAEAMSGRRGRWRAHVTGGLGLLENELEDDWIPTPVVARLLPSYLSLSSLCNLRMSTRLVALLNAPPEICHNLERSHGITLSLVRFVAHVSSLREQEHALTPANLDDLELNLYLQFPRAPSTLDASESVVVQHALNSFYYATVIYFRRTLRRDPVDQVQDLVEKAVQDLEAAEALTSERGGCAFNWASFVVAAECACADLQGRMLAFYERKRRHGIRNILILCEIVQAVWWRRERAGAGVDVHWEDLANEADFDIMLV